MSKAGAAYFLKVSGVGKTTHRKGTAAAHYRYVARTSAIGDCGGFLFPEDWLEAQLYLHRREKEIRTNGKVCDKIIVNLPYSLASDQRTELVKDFCEEISGGRAPYVWFVHTDTDAPHAHIIYVDADYETDKRVFKMSDSGALFRLRKVWESTLNKHLIAAGVEHRVSRWGKRSHHFRELNQMAAPAPANENSMANNIESNVVPFPPIKELEPQDIDYFDAAVHAAEELDNLERAQDRVAELTGQQNAFKLEITRNREAQKIIVDDINAASASLNLAMSRLDKMKGWKHAVQRWFSAAKRADYRGALEVKKSATTTLSTSTDRLVRLRQEADRLRVEEARLEGDFKRSARLVAAYGTQEEMKTHQLELEQALKEAVARLQYDEVRNAHQRGIIQPQQYARIVKSMGITSGYGY